VIGTTFANRYQILAPLGDGASGEVWRAMDTHQQRLVALKTFYPGSSTIHAYGEATILTALEGEHVLRVYNADTYEDIPYIATRIAAMGSSEGFRKANPLGLPPDMVVSWIRQALVGLGACHDRRLLHRDIKPENIFLDSPEFALLGDFGMAHQMDLNGIAPAEGTPTTIAPEMWSTSSGTTASDIYSMGVTAYRLLTGEWPFEGTRDELRLAVPLGKYVPLRDRAPHVSRRLGDRVRKAMELDPADRFADWREMHAELGRHGVVANVWRRIATHAGHDRCWTEHQAETRAKRRVCVVTTQANLVDIEVRHADGAGRRLPRLSKAGVDVRRLDVALREVFDRA
jgi:serine/threonine-protein kinase